MNAMMWVRGFAADYDEWARRAGPQWSYAEALGYFRRIENVTAAWHFVSGDDSGVTGPLHISRQRSPRPCYRGLAGRGARLRLSHGATEFRCDRKASARQSSHSAGVLATVPPTPI